MKRRGVARPVWLVFVACVAVLVLGLARRANDPVPRWHASTLPPPLERESPPERPVKREPLVARRFQIAFLRDGDVYLVSASGGKARRLTRGGPYWSLASDGNRLAFVRAGTREAGDGVRAAVYSLNSPRWQLTRRSATASLFTALAWLPGSDELVGAQYNPANGSLAWDLWRIRSKRSSNRRVTWEPDADSMAEHLIVSPGGTRVATLGTMSGTMVVHVVDVRTGKRVRQPGARGISGGTSIAWLDEDNLLVGAWPEEPSGGRGGVRRLDLRTRKLTPWLLSSRARVESILRSPMGDRFIVKTATATLLVDAGTRKQKRLKLTDTPLSFSPDGRQLLTIKLAEECCGCDELLFGDVYAVDLSSGRRRRVARGVNEAVWLEARP